ncbi:hypothetical protein GGH94_004246 [Coemansia aciculifera]|uniref:Phosphatidate phosphatase APP1 catalytic domain-containing protein n=1 Tax=Coemansia aciculifera TaxID=417176 RepID=A0A9W8IFT5_9FUNG|nr:hypothetical protein GGH94_004246 [Coemansia aciculifera]
MYQRDYDTVKSKLKGLWSQYSSGANNNPTTRDVTTSNNNNNNNNGSVELLEEMLLFPTYAYRDERLKVWRVQVRGWGFCRNPNTRRVRLAASLMRRFIRIPPGGESDQLLLDRVSYLFAGQPTSSDMIKVAMAGIAEPMPFELHTKQSHLHPPPVSAKPSVVQPAAASTSESQSSRPVNLLDAPIVLTTHFDPSGTIAQDTYTKPSGTSSSISSGERRHTHDRVVRNAFVGVEPTIIQKALQIDAFSWQNLVLDEGLFQGEILLGFNELEWLIQSYEASHSDSTRDRMGNATAGRKPRRLIELRGKLFGWPEAQIVGGLAHLVEPHGVSVVSDIDDTIKASNITAEKRIVLETVFARPMLAVPGMSELYREWYRLGCEFHYVSNSPWQLYPSLDEFFHKYKFPPGSAHLRSFDPNDLLSVKNYTGTPQLKSDTIETLFAMFPSRKFVLVGDCGEHDLETYTDLARRFPGRVLRIYIRDVFAPMSVAAVTTDTAAAGNTISQGIIPYGIVRPSKSRQRQVESESDFEADLIRLEELSDNDYDSDSPQQHLAMSQKQKPPPPVPPKPSHLRKVSSSSTPPVVIRNSNTPPPKPPRRMNTGDYTMPGSFTAPNMPLEPSSSTASSPGMGDRVTTAERFEARVNQLREQAQEWLAFYAQQFYVAPTQSFLRYSHVFMPTVEQNKHIIDYEAVAAAAMGEANNSNNAAAEGSDMPPHQGRQQQQQQSSRPGSMGQRAQSFGAYNIPEPPPPEAQLARTSRRLLLWKRYQLATQGLAPDLCRLFVDASDIKQDHELFDLLIPQNSV